MTAEGGSAGPLFTVVIPTCDRPDALRALIDAIVRQRRDTPEFGFEVIVGDDSAEVARTVAVLDGHAWAHHVVGPRRGPAANRNAAAAAASGRWLIFVDDDCVPCSGWLDAYVAAAETPGADGVIHMGRTTPSPALMSPLEAAPHVENLSSGFISCNFMVARSLYYGLGGFDERFQHAYNEDTEFGCRMTRRGVLLSFVSNAAAVHPPRRGRLKIRQAARLWRSRVLLDAIWTPPRDEWLALHVAKIRGAQLARYPLSRDWLVAAFDAACEVAVVACRAGSWRRAVGAPSPWMPARDAAPLHAG